MSQALDDVKALIAAQVLANGEAPEQIAISNQLYADLYVAEDPEVGFNKGKTPEEQEWTEFFTYKGTRIVSGG